MNLHKGLTLAAVTLSASIFLAIPRPAAAKASSYWDTEHWVTIRKTITVSKIKPGHPTYKGGKVLATYKILPGTHYKLGHPGSDYTWVLNSGKYKSGPKGVYSVTKHGSNWFQKGKQPLYKTFHGYRIEAYKGMKTFNTTYSKKTHSTASYLKPTQKKQVIFKYGTHVIPTKHEWDVVSSKTVTAYKYSNKKWHNLGTKD
ncbi:hypothetical protein ACFQET_04170 [Levilactobacillus tangyuanensis]|uniref:Surface layer protein A domain-containing protein n=1 Tax=Levilactobacillus tangyuanensis TaxID=2486021 RepID=A0ABW1TLH2_9LACO|nr:hypothetical protein [Levilactobacillus tangyuanensis]